MARNRNAVNPRECENVAKKKKLKIGKIPRKGLHQGSKISALRRGQKRSVQEPYSGAYKNFRSGLSTCQNKCKKSIFFIS